jgi:hypothetical protein
MASGVIDKFRMSGAGRIASEQKNVSTRNQADATES